MIQISPRCYSFYNGKPKKEQAKPGRAKWRRASVRGLYINHSASVICKQSVTSRNILPHTLSLCLSPPQIWCQAGFTGAPCVCLMASCWWHRYIWTQRNLINYAATLCSAAFNAPCKRAFVCKHSLWCCTQQEKKSCFLFSCFFYSFITGTTPHVTCYSLFCIEFHNLPVQLCFLRDCNFFYDSIRLCSVLSELSNRVISFFSK